MAIEFDLCAVNGPVLLADAASPALDWSIGMTIVTHSTP